jgi:uncharacterized membrane protein
LPSKTWKKVIRADKRALNAGILFSNSKFFNCFLLMLCYNLFFWMFFVKLGRSNSKKQSKLFKFEDKIPAFSTRLSVLSPDNYFPSFWWQSFFFSCQTTYWAKKHKKKIKQEKNWGDYICNVLRIGLRFPVPSFSIKGLSHLKTRKIIFHQQ